MNTITRSPLSLRPWAAALLGMAAAAPALAGEHDCVLEPRMTVDVRAPVEGLIEQVFVDRGDRIRAGQTLLVLDSGLEKANFEQAKYRATMVGAVKSGESRVEYAGVKLQRREKLADGQFVSLQDRDEAAAEKRLAEAELVQARENQRVAALEQVRAAEQLRLRTIKSPFNGVVTERMAHPGDLADNRDIRKPLLRIADVSVLHVEALLPVAAYRKLQPGQALEVLPDAPVGGKLSARVKTLDPVIDVGSGTFRVRLELPNADLRLPAGLTCRVEVPGVDKGAGGLAARSRPTAPAAPAAAAR
ncbi:efflux RND transporter periplasmic adaptor subunit [Ideonella sp. DXS22W]|uniref:Efflux RND transporter periplasmic adaptor subunit n=1 Tax=Pseudaquabacterium inlustre TaxID=2984192 RepID=A0ABU9CFN5_9BURK